jgi:hypothetical protein
MAITCKVFIPRAFQAEEMSEKAAVYSLSGHVPEKEVFPNL